MKYLILILLSILPILEIRAEDGGSGLGRPPEKDRGSDSSKRGGERRETAQHGGMGNGGP